MFHRVCIGVEVNVDIYIIFEFTYFIVVHLCNAIWLTERRVWIKIYVRLNDLLQHYNIYLVYF